jgi:hypothetical protein
MKRFAIGLTFVAALSHVGGVDAGVFGGGKENMMHSGDITVCFVGEAATKRPDRAEQIVERLKQFTYAANLHFKLIGKCPPPKRGKDGKDIYDGDIRVLTNDSGIDPNVPMAGRGCPGGRDKVGLGGWPVERLPSAEPSPDDPQSVAWSNFPAHTEQRLHCEYTMWLPGVGYLNVTLHEFGHAVGLAHEHERIDVDPTYCDGYVGGGNRSGLLTVYDPESVMHYSERAACTRIIGNYSTLGFSVKDKLILHMIYPEETRVAEFVGDTVVLDDENLSLIFGWRRRGAIVENVAKNFEWKLDGKSVSKDHNLYVKIADGAHALEYTYTDFLDRTYAYKGTVRAISAEQFKKTIRLPLAARMVLQ